MCVQLNYPAHAERNTDSVYQSSSAEFVHMSPQPYSGSLLALLRRGYRRFGLPRTPKEAINIQCTIFTRAALNRAGTMTNVYQDRCNRLKLFALIGLFADLNYPSKAQKIAIETAYHKRLYVCHPREANGLSQRTYRLYHSVTTSL